MKLDVLLQTLTGKELTAVNVGTIMAEVTTIKATAIKDAEAATATLQKKYDKIEKENTDFKAEADKEVFNKSWKDNGGIETDLTSYNLDKFKKEDKTMDFDKLFKELPHLKNANFKKPEVPQVNPAGEPQPQPAGASSVFSQITNVSGGAGGAEGGSGETKIPVY